MLDDVLDLVAPEDRSRDRRVFSDWSGKSLRGSMQTACRTAGIPTYSPHDLRHRWISRKLREGVPVADVAAHVGHSRQSITLDTYSHVLVED